MAADLDALRAQLADKRNEHNAAENAAAAARTHHGRLRGLQSLDEASPAQVAEAGASVIAAEDQAQALAHGVEILEERVRIAEAEDTECRRVEALEKAREADKAEHNAAKRLRTALNSARAAQEAAARAQSDKAAAHAELIELQRVDEREQAIRAKWATKVEELRLTAPKGQEPNWPALEIRMNDEIATMRRAAEAEASEALSSSADLDAIAAEFGDVTVRLVPPDLRQAIAAGAEFVREPASTSPYHGNILSTQRLYAAHEYPEAERRHAALVDALRRLGGPPAKPIGADQRN